jgi:hypothetical protein
MSVVGDVREGVLKQAEIHCASTRKIRAQLEYYQTLSLDPTGPVDPAKSGWFNSCLRNVKSVFTSLRGGPSMASTGRDLAIVVAIVAVLATFVTVRTESSTRLGKFADNNSFLMKAIVATINVLFLSLAMYLFYRTSIKQEIQQPTKS